jgi:hypothetical protein
MLEDVPVQYHLQKQKGDEMARMVAGLGLAWMFALSTTGAAMAADQAPASPPPAAQLAPAPVAAARAADVESIDGIVAALYDVISGPAGKPRDWDRMRSLFAPEAHLMIAVPHPDGSFALRTLTVEDYIGRNSKAFATMGFFERELARTSDSFGQIAQVFSTYESRHAANDAKPFQRGINSLQLFNDGKRWWVVNLVWRAEDERLPLPERYLRSR